MNGKEDNSKEKILLNIAENFLEKNVFSFYKEITKAFIEHKLSLIKDINIISAILLPGLVVFARDDIVKTKWLFYIGLLSFVILLIINIRYQHLLFSLEEKMGVLSENYMEKLNKCIIDCKLKGGNENYKRLDNLIEESHKPLHDRKKKFFHKHGEKIIYVLFFVGILSSIMSILL